jgi:hypothetical protein
MPKRRTQHRITVHGFKADCIQWLFTMVNMSNNNLNSKLNSSVSIVTKLKAGRTGFYSQQGQGHLLATASRTALGPTHPIQWVRGALSPGIKLPGREAEHSHTSSANVKNA